MYSILKNLIPAGGYKLADMQHKIKKMYLTGDLDEAQMDELLSMAAGGVSTDAERPETVAMIQTLAEKIEALEGRILALESGNPSGGSDGEETTEYPAWKPWDGISSNYQNGSIVSHNGQLWQSVFAGQNVWEPGAPGTGNLWVLYESH
jgi:hypothetical protein